MSKALKKKTSNISSESNVPAPIKEYSARDKVRINAAITKRQAPRAPSFKVGERENSIQEREDTELHRVGIIEAFGTGNRRLSHILTHQLMGAAPGETELKVMHLNASLAVLHGIKPRDEIESLLATQMAGVHNMAMEFMRRAMFTEQTHEGVTANSERATKMLRTFTTQMEALNRHRGKGQQKVTVEHVTVNSGGQAIVGQVENPGTKAIDQELEQVEKRISTIEAALSQEKTVN